MKQNSSIKEALLDTFMMLAAGTNKVPAARVLAKTAGVGLSSVYYHFHSLDHLAFSAITRQVQRHFAASSAEISTTTANNLVEDVVVVLDKLGNDEMLVSWLAASCTSPDAMSQYTNMLSQASAASIDEICRRYQLPSLSAEARLHMVGLILSMCIMRRASNANLGPMQSTARAVAALLTGFGTRPPSGAQAQLAAASY